MLTLSWNFLSVMKRDWISRIWNFLKSHKNSSTIGAAAPRAATYRATVVGGRGMKKISRTQRRGLEEKEASSSCPWNSHLNFLPLHSSGSKVIVYKSYGEQIRPIKQSGQHRAQSCNFKKLKLYELTLNDTGWVQKCPVVRRLSVISLRVMLWTKNTAD